MGGFILAIDQGTTSSRAIIFDDRMTMVASAQMDVRQHYPQAGWVEHDACEIWESVVATARQAVDKAGIAASAIAAIGITNQRETTVVWDRKTGRPGLTMSAVNAVYQNIRWAMLPCAGTGPDSEKVMPWASAGA
jgi:glycerol kinase